MPALKQEYDYYEYARTRKGTASNAASSSATKKSSQKVVQTMNIKTSPTRDVTKNATRMALRDDFITPKKKVNKQTKPAAAKNNASKKKEKFSDDFIKSKKSVKKVEELKLKTPKSNVKKIEIAKQKEKVKEMFKNFLVTSLVFGVLFLICYRYSTINEAFSELNTLKSDLKKKQTVNAQIELNIKQNTDLASIENYAKYQLGMQKPKDSQVQKINVQKQDKITAPIEIKEEKEIDFFEKIFNSILKVIE